MDGLEYETLYSSEGWGSHGGFGIKILVAATTLPDLKQKSIWYATDKAAELISAEVRAAILALSSDAQKRAEKERTELIGLFPEHIFVEAIPNGYCSQWCCRHLPWFIITTRIGRFKIGWRKRVINIDWSETVGTKDARELFRDEDTTRGGRGEKYIHAWGLDKAKEYIQAIMDHAHHAPTATPTESGLNSDECRQVAD